jgi:hypothetical protein
VPKDFQCDGCKGNHRFVENGVIVCPNKNEKGVMEAAMKARTARHAAYDAARAAKKKASQQVDFDKLDNANKKKVAKQVMQFLSDKDGGSDSDEPESPPKKAKKSVTIKTAHTFLYDIEEVPVLATTSRRPNLPVSIDTNLPHIPLQFGPSLDSANNPTIMSVVDTAAALTTGNLFFITRLAKMFPSCVAEVHTQKDYSPITLTGIVRSDAEGRKTTTELPAAFTFHLPYEMTDGTPTKLTIACGPDVSVNLILGLPFIKATRMVIDAAENVVECRLLDCEPFPIESKRARLEIPKADACLSETVTKECGSLLQDLEALESHWAGVYAIDPSTGATLSVKKRAVDPTDCMQPTAGLNDDYVVGAGTAPSFPNASRFMDNYVGPELGTGDETEGE